MSRNSFELATKWKSFWVGAVVILSLSTLGLVIATRSLNQVDAAGSVDWKNMTPADMTKLDLSLVFTGSEVDSTVNTTQSFAITNKYFVAIQADSVNENTGWLVATDINNPSSTPVWKKSYNVMHGNGATWNSWTNEIVVTHGKNRILFDANTGDYVDTLEGQGNALGIAYDSDGGGFIEMNGTGTSSGRIVDINFNILQTFDAGHRLVGQDVAYNNGYIYRAAWGGCGYLRNGGRTEDADFCEANFGNNSDVIYKFNRNGGFEEAYYIERGFGELESIDFYGGEMYLLFNGKPDGLKYSVYRVNGYHAPSKQTVIFPSGPVNKTYGDGNYIRSAMTDGDGAITYSSSNTSVATVDATSSEVTIKSAGTTTITATAAATSSYSEGSATYTLIVNKKASTAPSEVSGVKQGYVNDTLSTIELTTTGLAWDNADTIIEQGANVYPATYTENGDTKNYTTETYEITVEGINRSSDNTDDPDDIDDTDGERQNNRSDSATNNGGIKTPDTGEMTNNAGGATMGAVTILIIAGISILGYKYYVSHSHKVGFSRD